MQLNQKMQNLADDFGVGVDQLKMIANEDSDGEIVVKNGVAKVDFGC